MGFKMRSGNSPKFKMMGGTSPMKTHKKGHTQKDKTAEDYINEGFSPREALQMEKHQGVSGHVDNGTTIPKPKKSTKSAHGQLNDAELEYQTDKELYDKQQKGAKQIGTLLEKDDAKKAAMKKAAVKGAVEGAKEGAKTMKKKKKDTPVEPKPGDMEKYSDLEKYDDDNPTGKAKPKKASPQPPNKDKKKKSPAKQLTDPKKKKKDDSKTKTYPPSYTEKDIKFLKEQREDVVRYEDLDEKGKAIWRKQGKPVPKKKKSPAKNYKKGYYGIK